MPATKKSKPATQWQAQIFNSEVDEWYGWAHTDYDSSSKSDAERAGNIARQYGWKTRVVRVRSNDEE